MIDVPYKLEYGAAILCAAVLAGLGVAASQADTLGLSPQALGWMAVATAVVGVIASVLPNLRKPPSPEREGLD